jgi:hypothetical protein
MDVTLSISAFFTLANPSADQDPYFKTNICDITIFQIMELLYAKVFQFTPFYGIYVALTCNYYKIFIIYLEPYARLVHYTQSTLPCITSYQSH